MFDKLSILYVTSTVDSRPIDVFKAYFKQRQQHKKNTNSKNLQKVSTTHGFLIFKMPVLD